MTALFPNEVYKPRVTENLPGVVYDEAETKNFFSEDFQGLGAEIEAIETVLEDQYEFKETIIISSAQIKAWFTTPVVLLSAPGAGKIIVPSEIVLFYDFGTVRYSNGGKISLQYTGGGNNLTSPIDPTAITATDNTITFRPMEPIYITEGENASLVLCCSTSNFTTGNGSVKVFIRYRILDVSES